MFEYVKEVELTEEEKASTEDPEVLISAKRAGQNLTNYRALVSPILAAYLNGIIKHTKSRVVDEHCVEVNQMIYDFCLDENGIGRGKYVRPFLV